MPSESKAFRDRVADYLKARPGQWVDASELVAIGGKYGWRTRVSNCRRQLGMQIDNRPVWRHRLECATWLAQAPFGEPHDCNCRRYKDSEYRYVPAVEAEPVSGHNLNAEWELR